MPFLEMCCIVNFIYSKIVPITEAEHYQIDLKEWVENRQASLRKQYTGKMSYCVLPRSEPLSLQDDHD